MADSNTNITDALKKLDVGNDDHWTEGKEPAMAAVKELTGDTTITREQVTKAAEGFSRDTAAGFFMAAGGEVTKPWEAGKATDADGNADEPGVSEDADGKPQVPGESQQADGTTKPSDEAPKDVVDPAEINPNQANVLNTPPDPAVDAEGKPTGISTEGMTFDSAEREGLLTSGEEGDNVDVEDKPSGVPTPVAEGDVSLHPAPFNPEQPQQAPTGDGGTGPESAAELVDSPRADGAAEDDTASDEGRPADSNGQAEQSSLGMPGSGEDEIPALEEELASRDESIAGLRLTADEANKAVMRAQAEADKLRERIERLRPMNSNQATISAYLESQKREGQRRGESRAVLAGAGIKIKDLQKAVGKAPIDEAMSRKTGRGGRRPTRV